MSPALYHLFIEDHLTFIHSLVTAQIEAEVVPVPSRNDLSNRLALSRWGDPTRADRILISRTISVGEQMSILMEIGSGRIGDEVAGATVGRIFKTSRDILAFLVLHEVAHIKFNWGKSRDRACSRWALGQIGALNGG